MMKVSEALSVAWKAATDDAGETPGYYRRRIPLPLSLPVYGGVVVPGNTRRLSMEFEQKSLLGLNFKDRTRGYLVESEPQSTEKSLFVHLQEAASPMPKDLFHIFSVDILEHILPTRTAAEAARTLYRRLEHWKKFFQRRAPEGLSRDEYIGLFGELDFFERCLQHGVSAQVLSDAWQGPLGTNQDFLFGKLAVEVKAVTANDAGGIRISNMRQLDDAGLDGLFLSHISYDFREGTDRKLASLIESIKTRLENSPDALSTFEDRLLASGYLEPESSPFAGYGLTERQRSFYRIRNGFPRILESNIISGISNVSYSVSLSACSGFSISEAELMSLLPY